MDYLFNISKDDYKEWCKSHQLPSFTLSQVIEWVTKKHIIEFDLMTNISKGNQEILKNSLIINPFQSIETLPASDGSATKYIFQIEPHIFIEAVAIQEKDTKHFAYHLKRDAQLITNFV